MAAQLVKTTGIVTVRSKLRLLGALVAVIALATGFFARADESKPRVSKGALDLVGSRDTDLTSLGGEWDFFWRQLIDPAAFGDQRAPKPGYFNLPGVWSGHSATTASGVANTLTADGFATYHLRVSLPPKMRQIGIHLPYFYGWVKVFLNGEPVRELGGFHGFGRATDPAGEGSHLYYTVKTSELDIVIQTANYGTALGGTFNSSYIGGMQAVAERESLEVGLDFVLISAFLLTAFYHVAMFMLRPKDRYTLWFAAFCLMISLRVAINGSGSIVHTYLHAPVTWAWRLELISYYLAVPILCSFITLLFPREAPRRYANASWVVGVGLTALTLFSPSTVFEPALSVMQLFNIAIMPVYLWSIVKAIRHRRSGARIFLFGFSLMCVLVFLEIMERDHQVEMRNLSSVGVYIFLFSQSTLLAKRFNNAFIQVERDEERIHRLNDELKANAESRSRFFHNTSHELRTPLNGILGFGQMIRSGNYGAVPQKVQEQVEKIEMLAHSLMFQVNNILDLAKTRRGEMRLITSQIPLDEICEEVQVVAEGLVMQANDASFEMSKSWAGQPTSPFVSDREKLTTVIRNLVGNAFKFADPDRPNRVSLNFIRQADGSLRITASDSGIGIPVEQRAQIFGEFEQLQQDARRRYGGTGLGLAMVKDLVELMGGTVSVESRVGRGSTFTVTLPAQAAATISVAQSHPFLLRPMANQAVNAEVGDEPEAAAPAPAAHPQPYKILVIDDNAINCEVISDILVGRGYPVCVAYGGSAGLIQARAEKPDLVLLDLMMPEVSGEDVIREFKGDRDLAQVPVIILTARASQEDRLNALDLGADDYLAKPLVAEELLLRVKNTLSRLHLAKVEAQREMLETSLMQAQAVHSSLGAAQQNLPGIKIATHYKAAEMAGGDWFGFNYDEKNKRVYMLIGDVTGHDMLSALVTVAAAGAFKGAMSSIKRLGSDQSKEACLRLLAEILNDAVRDAGQHSAKLMTLALLAVDVETGAAAYVNAGHTPVLHVKEDAVNVILKPANPLGLDAQVTIGTTAFQMSVGDGLFTYTDGLLENTGPTGQKLPVRTLKNILLSSQQPSEVLGEILVNAQNVWQAKPPKDDCTFIYLKWEGLEASPKVSEEAS